MRWDYLYRFYPRFGEGGFRRLMNEGFSCDNTHLNYIPTVTAIGHSSIYTGSVPSIHGIAGNNFYKNDTLVYCTDDPTVTGVGSNSPAGKMSPRNLLVTTIGDELKLATNFRSRVIGVASTNPPEALRDKVFDVIPDFKGKTFDDFLRWQA